MNPETPTHFARCYCTPYPRSGMAAFYGTEINTCPVTFYKGTTIVNHINCSDVSFHSQIDCKDRCYVPNTAFRIVPGQPYPY